MRVPSAGFCLATSTLVASTGPFAGRLAFVGRCFGFRSSVWWGVIEASADEMETPADISAALGRIRVPGELPRPRGSIS